MGAVARGLSFSLPSELLASLASMLLFAPASYTAVYLGWVLRPSARQVGAILVAIVACFIAWNAIMLPGSPIASLAFLVQANAGHWLLYFACGWISLRLAQWITRIGIVPAGTDSEPAPSAPRRLSLAKLMMLTVVCGLLAETARRWELSGPGPEALPIRSIEKATAVTGALGGLLLGLQWSVLFWLRTTGSLRTAGFILWIALGAILRWCLTLPLDSLLFGGSAYELHLLPGSQHFVVRRPEFTDPRELGGAIRFLVEATVQTGLVLLGIHLLAMAGLPIRFHPDREQPSHQGRAPALPPLP